MSISAVSAEPPRSTWRHPLRVAPRRVQQRLRAFGWEAIEVDDRDADETGHAGRPATAPRQALLLVRRRSADVGERGFRVALQCQVAQRHHPDGGTVLEDRDPSDRRMSDEVHRFVDGVLR